MKINTIKPRHYVSLNTINVHAILRAYIEQGTGREVENIEVRSNLLFVNLKPQDEVNHERGVEPE